MTDGVFVRRLLVCHPPLLIPPVLPPPPFSLFAQQAEMEERRQFMLDQILLPEAKERLARIGTWCVCVVCVCASVCFFYPLLSRVNFSFSSFITGKRTRSKAYEKLLHLSWLLNVRATHAPLW